MINCPEPNRATAEAMHTLCLLLCSYCAVVEMPPPSDREKCAAVAGDDASLQLTRIAREVKKRRGIKTSAI
jgi:hypothetical protein